MKHKKLCVTAAMVLGLSVQAGLATSVSLDGGDGSLGVGISMPLGSSLRADFGYLNTDNRRGNADLYSAGLMIAPAATAVHWEIGARYQYQDARYGSGGGIGLGGSLYVSTPIPRVSIGGYGFYTPDSLTSGALDNSYDYGAQVRLNVNRSFSLFGGYRVLRSEFNDRGSHDLYKGPMFGLNVGL
jgi:hypothetical protein